MGPFEIAAIAIVGGFVYAGYEVYMKTKSKAGKGELEGLQAELQRLKERVSTLESIVTDKSYQLKDQINKL
ncbi:hypothetical protein SAMN06297280_2700 [Arsukibacterium tuosuense]|uniref:Uncharacterized protein n=1 Tax=Arsukibacterium tuosuense TaxID=1323745 RepID=A0A285J2U8_9GAMM|nr:hypothetical protein [Arsukibacterium tuosuense]SNY54650.1 hypothetical protein SAMN06297280_2700 [Arsukibacterium tuosuense]